MEKDAIKQALTSRKDLVSVDLVRCKNTESVSSKMGYSIVTLESLFGQLKVEVHTDSLVSLEGALYLPVNIVLDDGKKTLLIKLPEADPLGWWRVAVDADHVVRRGSITD